MSPRAAREEKEMMTKEKGGGFKKKKEKLHSFFSHNTPGKLCVLSCWPSTAVPGLGLSDLTQRHQSPGTQAAHPSYERGTRNKKLSNLSGCEAASDRA